nr:2-hydroxy-3-oxopropionate reductase [Maliibacterium massiliense]
MKPTIGFIGLGIMGKPMAKNLIKAGYPLVVYDPFQPSVEALMACGARAAGNAKEVAAQVDIVITMVPNGPQVKDCVLDTEHGVIAGAKAGMTVIDMSSIAPLVSKEVGAALAQKGVVFFDAPVSGGEPKAIDGTLSIMVGGPADKFEAVKPLLLTMGASAVLVGEVGSGNTAKLANQIIVACNIAGLSEALVMATKAGVDPEKVFQAIRGGLAGSTVMEAKAPMMLAGNDKPGFKIDLHIKDLNNAIETMEALALPQDMTTRALHIFQTLAQAGKGQLDHSAMVQYYEALAGVTVKK